MVCKFASWQGGFICKKIPNIIFAGCGFVDSVHELAAKFLVQVLKKPLIFSKVLWNEHLLYHYICIYKYMVTFSQIC